MSENDRIDEAEEVLLSPKFELSLDGDGDDNQGYGNQGDDIHGDGDNLDILLDLVALNDTTPVNQGNGTAVGDGVSLDMDDIIFDEGNKLNVS